MPTAFDTPVLPFTGAFADLPTQWIEASTRALTASAELYTQTLQLQADATRELIETYAGLGATAVRPGGHRRPPRRADGRAGGGGNGGGRPRARRGAPARDPPYGDRDAQGGQ